MLSKLHVLHITEASSAGVLHSAGQLARIQATQGASVEFAYIRRHDSPADDEFDALLGSARRTEFGSPDLSTAGRILAIARYVREAARTGKFDVIHAHSSLAGAAARARRGPAAWPELVYSPHGFAFLREDVPPLVRFGYRMAERLLAQRGCVVTVSRSEARIAAELRPHRVAVIPNAVEIGPLPPMHTSPRPVVGMVGRIAYQKAPWRFAQVARAYSDIADFRWIGDGQAEDRARWLDDAPVQVTGWLSREKAREAIAALSLVCFPTLWEGMPLALIDAQALGVPVVASNIVGNEDVVVDGETGFLVDSDLEMESRVGALLTDAVLRQRMSAAAAAHARRTFDIDQTASQSLELYRELVSTSRTRR